MSRAAIGTGFEPARRDDCRSGLHAALTEIGPEDQLDCIGARLESDQLMLANQLDATAPGPLQAGMVITVEPGIYIPKENIGIRIEDTVLVTDKGVELLSGALPREPGDVEKAMAH